MDCKLYKTLYVESKIIQRKKYTDLMNILLDKNMKESARIDLAQEILYSQIEVISEELNKIFKEHVFEEMQSKDKS